MGVAYLAAYIDLQQPIVGVVAESSSDRSINTDGVNTVGNEVEGYLAAILGFHKGDFSHTTQLPYPCVSQIKGQSIVQNIHRIMCCILSVHLWSKERKQQQEKKYATFHLYNLTIGK